MHFSKIPTVKCGRMTRTTRARCRNRPLKRAVEKPPPLTFGKHFAAAHTILNLDDESKNDHRNDLIVLVADLSYDKQRRTINCILCEMLPTSVPEAPKDLHRQFN